VRDLREIAAVRERMRAGGSPAILATVVTVTGSAYRGPGARLLLLADGTAAGCVSGGCLERDVRARADALRETGRAELVSYDLSEDDAPWGLGMRCGGKLALFLEPLAGGFPDHLTFLLDAAAARRTVVVALLFRASGAGAPPLGARLMLDGDGGATGSLAGTRLGAAVLEDARATLASGETRVASYSVVGVEAGVLLEHVPPPVALLVCGDEREAAPLLTVADQLGWNAQVLGKHDAIPPLDARSAAVVMTHSDARDMELLPPLLATPARYVGLLGSRARTAQLLADLRARGALAPNASLERLHTPAGLDIGAETPGEVALAIAAEIQAVFAGKGGGPLRERKGHIHAGR
jgi:xanthine/CO dehydrogenase XdhC/CoxF family maturation factor